MALIIDAMDILYTKDIDVICLVSSDCDFTPLVTRSLADGKLVIGFGERKTPPAFVNSCSKFLYFDGEAKKSNTDPEKVSSLPNKTLNRDTKLINLLRQALEAVEEDDGWGMLGHIGTHISNHTSFDQRNYGYQKLGDLFSAIDLFEIKKTKGSVLWIKDKRK
jgi:uncharacterized LabA/DUF88 family protein